MRPRHRQEVRESWFAPRMDPFSSVLSNLRPLNPRPGRSRKVFVLISRAATACGLVIAGSLLFNMTRHPFQIIEALSRRRPSRRGWGMALTHWNFLRDANRLIAVGMVILVQCASSSLAYAAEAAGTVKTAQGTVFVERAVNGGGSAKQILHVGDAVLEGDRLETGPDGAAGITLRDDSLVSLGPNAAFDLERFSFDPASNHGTFFGKVVRGAMMFVTGLVAKTSPSSMKISTPTATIGIRGTEFIVDVPAGLS